LIFVRKGRKGKARKGRKGKQKQMMLQKDIASRRWNVFRERALECSFSGAPALEVRMSGLCRFPADGRAQSAGRLADQFCRRTGHLRREDPAYDRKSRGIDASNSINKLSFASFAVFAPPLRPLRPQFCSPRRAQPQ